MLTGTQQGKLSMMAKVDLPRSPNRRRRDRSLASRFTGSAAVHDDSHQLLSWDAPLRWIRLATWLLVTVVSLWDIARTFGRHL